MKIRMPGFYWYCHPGGDGKRKTVIEVRLIKGTLVARAPWQAEPLDVEKMDGKIVEQLVPPAGQRELLRFFALLLSLALVLLMALFALGID